MKKTTFVMVDKRRRETATMATPCDNCGALTSPSFADAQQAKTYNAVFLCEDCATKIKGAEWAAGVLAAKVHSALCLQPLAAGEVALKLPPPLTRAGINDKLWCSQCGALFSAAMCPDEESLAMLLLPALTFDLPFVCTPCAQAHLQTATLVCACGCATNLLEGQGAVIPWPTAEQLQTWKKDREEVQQ